MTRFGFHNVFLGCCLCAVPAMAQVPASPNDTIRLGAVEENGRVFAMILLPEHEVTAKALNDEEVRREAKLKNDIFTVYPYAIAAAEVLKNVKGDLERMDSRHDRKKYLKNIDDQLDKTFKQPLKQLTIDQGHVLIKLVDRQTGQSCFDIIRELKSGFAAVMWQSVGVFFNNNIRKPYDPLGEDKDMERLVREIESSSLYRYELYQQSLLLGKVKKK